MTETTMQPGVKVTTPFGTGFVIRCGSICSDHNCSCDDETSACRKDVPMAQVDLDGGAKTWIDIDKRQETT